jgi:hypothetical protein
LEVTGLSVETDRGELHLYSLYYPPKKEFHQTDFDFIKNENKATIAAGDLGARNTGTAKGTVQEERHYITS